MLRLRFVLTAALLMVTLTSLAPASAGGPTSALLSVPGEGRTASLYYTDPEYDALADLVGIEGATGFGSVDRSGTDHASGPGVTVTWLIHDVTPWRVDHIYLGGNGAPWIATQVAGETGSIWDSEAVWHQSENGKQLAALLDELGVAEAARDASDFSGVAGQPAPEPSQETMTSTPAPSSEPSSGSSGLWWGLAGLLAGVLLTALVLRPRRTQDTPDSDPSLDIQDGPGVPVPGPAEELSWPARRS